MKFRRMSERKFSPSLVERKNSLGVVNASGQFSEMLFIRRQLSQFVSQHLHFNFLFQIKFYSALM